MSNVIYKKDLHDIALAVAENSKAYTDKKVQDILWKVGEYDITTQNDNTTALVKTAPSGATRVKIKSVSGNCVKYAPSTASDDSIVKDKVIPENSYTTELNTLGGMSYKSENLLPLSDIAERTVDGITYKVENGVITLNGTATARVQIFLSTNVEKGTISINYFNDFLLASGLMSINFRDSNQNLLFYLNNFTTTNITQTHTISKNIGEIYINIPLGTALTNATFKPMIVEGTTAPTEFKQGFEGIRNTPITSVVVSGNLLALDGVLRDGSGASLGTNTTISGMDVSIDSDNNIITIDGTTNVDYWSVYLYLTTPLVLKAGNSYSFANLGTGTFTTYINNNTSVTDLTNLTEDITITRLRIYIHTNGTTKSGTFAPMLIKGSTAPTVFKPYITPITKAIPSEVLALEGIGWGINSSVYNYISLVNKKNIQKVGRVDLDSLSWSYNSTYGFWQTYGITDSALVGSMYLITNAIAQNYTSSSWNTVVAGNENTIALPHSDSDRRVLVNNGSSETTPTGYIYYELAEPIETDISSYLPTDFNKIATDNNYTNIEFVSDYGYDIPNKVSYYGIIKETLCTAINKNDALAVSLTNNEAKYGWSAGSVYNTRDYTTNKGSQKVIRYTFTGNETITKTSTVSGGGYRFNVELPFTINTDSIIVCDTLEYQTAGEMYATTRAEYGIAVRNATAVYVYIESLAESGTIRDVATWLANNTTTIYIQLATEVVEDITPLDNNVIEVVENDELGFINSENQAVPSEITYRIEVEK